MSDFSMDSYRPEIDAAQHILSERFGANVQIEHVENLTPDRDRSIALRLGLHGNHSDMPRHVILKHSITEGQSPYDRIGSPIHRLVNDYAGCLFLNPIVNEPSLAPLPYGFDHSLAFMLIEDIPNDHQSLVQPLLEGDATMAETALAQMMTRLGQMHANTMGMADNYAALRDKIAPRPDRNHRMMAAMYRTLGPSKLREVFEAVEYVPDDGIWTELNQVLDAIANPQPFLAYVHGDPCPDNLLFSDGKLRIIDFELGGFGHCLLDAIYPRMMFPSCWCANMIPMDVVEHLESLYREELSEICPQIKDDAVFQRGLAVAGGLWLINTLVLKLMWGDQPYDEDMRWGISSHHPRIIARLKRFAETAEPAGVYPALQSMCHDLHDLLGERWEHAAAGLPNYPAFLNER
jgi:hypothetical protein